MNLLPRKRQADAVPTAPASAWRQLAGRLRGFLVARKVRAVLSGPGATASAAAAGLAAGLILGAVLVAVVVAITTEDPE